jgi:AcrR family transcriptional regulator
LIHREAGMASRDTQERILDAAERLFGENGFPATSLRRITTEAGVNVAAIHYHYGSKEELLRAVIDRRVGPVNERRLKLLEELTSGPRAPTLEQVLRSFLEPALELEQDMEREGASLRRVVGRLYGEPLDLVQSIIQQEFGELLQRYVAVLEAILPDCSEAEVRWRMQLAVGAMIHVLIGNAEINMGSASPPSGESPEAVLEQMVSFLAAGFRAPPPGPDEGSTP